MSVAKIYDALVADKAFVEVAAYEEVAEYDALTAFKAYEAVTGPAVSKEYDKNSKLLSNSSRVKADSFGFGPNIRVLKFQGLDISLFFCYKY
jgi:hypothetical protein